MKVGAGAKAKGRHQPCLFQLLYLIAAPSLLPCFLSFPYPITERKKKKKEKDNHKRILDIWPWSLVFGNIMWGLSYLLLFPGDFRSGYKMGKRSIRPWRCKNSWGKGVKMWISASYPPPQEDLMLAKFLKLGYTLKLSGKLKTNKTKNQGWGPPPGILSPLAWGTVLTDTFLKLCFLLMCCQDHCSGNLLLLTGECPIPSVLTPGV